MRIDSSAPTAPARDQATGGVALLIIDMINTFEFPGGENLLPPARAVADTILALRAEAADVGVPVIYVNDNFGEWHSEKWRLLDHAAGKLAHPGLVPGDGDYFIIKPQFSGFYATNLPVLLPKLGINRLVLTGVATDICILFTAADAHMRDYTLWVPTDAVAAEVPERGAAALEIMRQSMGVETRGTGALSLASWRVELDR